MLGEKLYIDDFSYLLERGSGGNIKTFCPFCREQRSNKRDKSLSINRETLAYNCHYCGRSGYLVSRLEESRKEMDRLERQMRKTYKKPTFKPHIEPKIDPSIAEYFKGRGISEDTLLKAKVTKETAYFGQDGCSRGCIAFNYYVNGEHINTKYRTRDKHFSFVAGAKTVPYNIDSIAPSSYHDDETRYCIITEGEIDALSYIECGYEHVVSMPSGANTNMEWMDDFMSSHFEHLDIIYLSTDSDTKGVEAKDEFIRRLGAENVKVISYPDGCKDINEVLVAHGRDAVRRCYEAANDIRPAGILEVGDIRDNLDDLFANGFQKGETIGVESIDSILSFRVGMLMIITGIPSHGKTQALDYLLLRLNILHDWKVGFFSPEFYPVHEHVAQVIETLGGQRFDSGNYTAQSYDMLKDYVSRNFFWIDPDDTDLDSILDRAKFLIRKKGIRVLVIDPFNSITSKKRGSQKQDEYISDFLQQMRWFARKYHILLCIVMHPIKQTKLDNGLYPVCDLYSCKGASEIYDKADIGLTVWRNEKENYAEFHVTKMKFRHLGSKGKATFRFDMFNGRYTPIPNADEIKGTSMVSVESAPDRTNWVIEKIKAAQVQSDIGFAEPVRTERNYGGESRELSAHPDMPFAPPAMDNDLPF